MAIAAVLVVGELIYLAIRSYQAPPPQPVPIAAVTPSPPVIAAPTVEEKAPPIPEVTVKPSAPTAPIAVAIPSPPISATPTELTYWDFLGGGDGVRMKQIVEQFNESQNGHLNFDDLPKQGTKSLQLIAHWVKEGLIQNTGYSSMQALFSAGLAVFMINGNWEVPTMVDLQEQGKLPFEYGVAATPRFFDNQDTWADSHQLAIPNNEKNPASPEKVAAALKFIAYVVKQVTWAGGGHIPAYLPVQESEEYKQIAPNNEYSPQAARDVDFEPLLPIFGAGGPTFAPISNFLVPVVNGQLSVDQGIKQFTGELEKFAKEQQ